MLNFSDPNLSCHVYRHIEICSQKMLTSSADDVVLNKKRRKLRSWVHPIVMRCQEQGEFHGLTQKLKLSTYCFHTKQINKLLFNYFHIQMQFELQAHSLANAVL